MWILGVYVWDIESNSALNDVKALYSPSYALSWIRSGVVENKSIWESASLLQTAGGPANLKISYQYRNPFL